MLTKWPANTHSHTYTQIVRCEKGKAKTNEVVEKLWRATEERMKECEKDKRFEWLRFEIATQFKKKKISMASLACVYWFVLVTMINA